MIATVPKTPRMLRLTPADNVLVAIDVVDKGATAPEGIAALERIGKGHKMAAAEIRAGEPVRKFGQIIGFAKQDIPPGRLGARAQYRHAGLRPRLCLRRRTRSPRTSCRSSQQATFQGYPPRQRQGRHPQLHRHPDLGELLGHRRRLHRRGDRSAPACSTTIPTSTASWRSSMDNGCVIDYPRRDLRHPQAHQPGAMPPTPTWAAC